jgi:DNA phosphorothioation-dependent restriction protein DptG
MTTKEMILEDGEAHLKPLSKTKNEMNAEEINSKATSLPRLSTILKQFVEMSRTSGHYFLANHTGLIVLSNWLYSIPLTIPEM